MPDRGLEPDPEIAAFVRVAAEHYLSVSDDRWAGGVNAPILGRDPDDGWIDDVPRSRLRRTPAPARRGSTCAYAAGVRAKCVMDPSTDWLRLCGDAAWGCVCTTLGAGCVCISCLARFARKAKTQQPQSAQPIGAVAQRTEQGRPKALVVGSTPTSPSAAETLAGARLPWLAGRAWEGVSSPGQLRFARGGCDAKTCAASAASATR